MCSLRRATFVGGWLVVGIKLQNPLCLVESKIIYFHPHLLTDLERNRYQERQSDFRGGAFEDKSVRLLNNVIYSPN